MGHVYAFFVSPMKIVARGADPLDSVWQSQSVGIESPGLSHLSYSRTAPTAHLRFWVGRMCFLVPVTFRWNHGRAVRQSFIGDLRKRKYSNSKTPTLSRYLRSRGRWIPRTPSTDVFDVERGVLHVAAVPCSGAAAEQSPCPRWRGKAAPVLAPLWLRL